MLCLTISPKRKVCCAVYIFFSFFSLYQKRNRANKFVKFKTITENSHYRNHPCTAPKHSVLSFADSSWMLQRERERFEKEMEVICGLFKMGIAKRNEAPAVSFPLPLLSPPLLSSPRCVHGGWRRGTDVAASRHPAWCLAEDFAIRR